ncbi:MAG: ammonium transporter [Nitrospirae bacterium]|nr:MAG: ammonium transporter [Nitrospirota bacterium]
MKGSSRRVYLSVLPFFVFLMPSVAAAAEGKIDTGDTTWLLISSALVMLMTPGLALFYGGMVRRKNVLGTIMHSFIALAVITLQWVIIGYTLSFGPDVGGFIGSLKWFGLSGVGVEPSKYAPTVPHLAFMIYQAMFAIITPALISGAFAERMKFSAYLLFILLWSTFVYDPVAHWIWGGGWMSKLGVLDFAGGIVVHATAGISALAAAIIVGKRKGYPEEPMTPHNLPMTVLGAGLLWFGWFGFNAGSALSSGGLATVALVNTHVAAATATLIWIIIEWIKYGKPTMFGAATGCIAGLATITPAAGFVTPMSAILTGLAAGAICFLGLKAKGVLGYDDSLDAFGVHGVGGILGTLCIGFFATTTVNSAGAEGILYGNAHQMMVQVIGAGGVALYSLIVSVIILKIIDWTIGLRIDEDSEIKGLDLAQHGEEGYFL